ncbi:class I SAM-dependent methyltransferase [Epibacterium sp. DP7N7-1]|nr:class I SAM-dependent methyltransferase [Epibacterium sp. DP7N7-1]
MAWHQLYDTSVLFYGRDILVIAKHFDGKRCVVTFSPRLNEDDLPQEPFGGALLEKEEVSYIAVISTRNHWWVTGEFEPAMERIAAYVEAQRYDTLVGYGGSMGGVGAIHSSQYLSYDKAVVFGAQYDISPDIVPWDMRWHADAQQYGVSLKAGSDSASRDMEIVYLFDPFTLDKRHMETFQTYLNVTAVAFPFSGHELFRTLKEVGLAGETVKGFLLSSDSASQISHKIKAQYKAKRGSSYRVFRNILTRAHQNKKRKIANWASKRLAQLGKKDIASLHMLGLSQLTDKKDAKGSEAFYDQALALCPDHPASWRGKAKSRQFAQDGQAATIYALAALARGPGSADLSRVTIEAAHRAQEWELLSLVCARHIKKFPDEAKSDFYKRFSAPVTERTTNVAGTALDTFEEALELIRTRRPHRYAQLYQTLAVLRPQSIAEIGVFNGDTASHMLKMATSAQSTTAPALEYYGFDLFEDMTPELHATELSKFPLSRDEIATKLAPTGAKVSLFKGMSQETLSKFKGKLCAEGKHLDFVFLDGGHKEETIFSDWVNIEPLLKVGSVVFLDDFYVEKPKNIQRFGCNKLVKKLSKDPRYAVEILPVQDRFNNDFGVLNISMVQVRVLSTAALMRKSVEGQTFLYPDPTHTAGSVTGMPRAV